MARSKVLDPNCSIARSLDVLGERWTFLILREAMDGVTRFAQFRDALGIAPDVLTDRLTTLVDYGVMTRAPYQDPGSRSRYAYTLTPSGKELYVALGSLQQWGDTYLPRPDGPTIERRTQQETTMPIAATLELKHKPESVPAARDVMRRALHDTRAFDGNLGTDVLVDQDDPYYAVATEMLGRRWAAGVLRALITGPARFSDIAAAIPGMTDKLLPQRLKDLEADGLVERLVHAGPPVRVEYRLTEKGAALSTILLDLNRWALKWIDLPADH